MIAKIVNRICELNFLIVKKNRLNFSSQFNFRFSEKSNRKVWIEYQIDRNNSRSATLRSEKRRSIKSGLMFCEGSFSTAGKKKITVASTALAGEEAY